MALKKAMTRNGFTAEYWFLKQLTLVRNGHDEIRASLEPYKDAEQRAEKAIAVGFPTPHFDLSAVGEQEVTYNGEPYKKKDLFAFLAYEMIKEAAQVEAAKEEPTPENGVSKNEDLAFFADAVDV